MATPSWLNKIWYKKDTNEIEYKIGTTFDQVRVSNTNHYTLAQLMSEFTTFFSRKAFMHYSINEPSNKNTIEWYQITKENNETLDTNINPNEI